MLSKHSTPAGIDINNESTEGFDKFEILQSFPTVSAVGCYIYLMPTLPEIIPYWIEARYAAISSGFIILWLIFEYMLGLHGPHIGYYPYFVGASLFVPAAGILMPIWRKKMYSLEGYSFNEAFFTGMRVTAVLTITLPLIYLVFFTTVSTDLFDNIQAYAYVNAYRFGLSPARAMSRFGQLFNLQTYLIAGFLGMMVYGALISALGSYLFRTK